MGGKRRKKGAPPTPRAGGKTPTTPTPTTPTVEKATVEKVEEKKEEEEVLDQVAFAQPIRPLHWVIKVSNLKKTLQLLEGIGCRVLRHEEFEEGCEANCNGPYAGYWS